MLWRGGPSCLAARCPVESRSLVSAHSGRYACLQEHIEYPDDEDEQDTAKRLYFRHDGASESGEHQRPQRKDIEGLGHGEEPCCRVGAQEIGQMAVSGIAIDSAS
jgi:hypothetical protein